LRPVIITAIMLALALVVLTAVLVGRIGT